MGSYFQVVISFTASAVPIFMLLCNPVSLRHYVKSSVTYFTRIGGVLCQGINPYKPLHKVRISLRQLSRNPCLLDNSSTYFRDISINGLVAGTRSQTGGQMVTRKVECDLHIRCSFLKDAQIGILTSRTPYQVYGN